MEGEIMRSMEFLGKAQEADEQPSGGQEGEDQVPYMEMMNTLKVIITVTGPDQKSREDRSIRQRY